MASLSVCSSSSSMSKNKIDANNGASSFTNPDGDRTKWYRTKWYTDKMVWDKMVWTKWYGQNGTDKMVVIFLIDCNSSEFNSYLVTKSHSEMINIQRKPKRLKVEAGLMKKSYCQWEWN